MALITGGADAAELEWLRERERILGWLSAEVAHARVPELDPSQWRGPAARVLGRRLVELSYFVDEAARHLADARDGSARAARVLEARALDG